MKHNNYLLIQLRKDLFTKQEEYLRFLVTGDLAPKQLDVWDVFLEPDFDYQRCAEYQAIFIGGSSDDPDDYVYFDQDAYPFTDNLMEAIRFLYKQQIPVFASCMGFHVIHQALGGEIIIDLEHKETGTYEFHLNEEGMKDPLFDDMPAEFPVVSYHKKRAHQLPEGFINLGYTELCPVHAVSAPGRLFYAFQFHPELDAATVARWARRYQFKYGLSNEYVRDLEENQTDTSVSSSLLKNFLRLVDEQKKAS